MERTPKEYEEEIRKLEYQLNDLTKSNNRLKGVMFVSELILAFIIAAYSHFSIDPISLIVLVVILAIGIIMCLN